ncbi:Cyclin, N-terminal domain [Nakaseomyces glabratus]|nr:Cyclin, N-terminal domain [Nakaseomyces glabratus]KAH7580389.1 Cyclin, N-terminal domain [Nakaseomyces glabratus]KAI8382103.1 Cyclin, N-terminal domain [Nakaseomyces glabratus]KAI8392330.1 Cyclin, N-terminal domain [Nakaseomyces glabratus]KAJ9573003.1 hypothetical protein LTX96_0000137 [Nakaseomyces glabratus]
MDMDKRVERVPLAEVSASNVLSQPVTISSSKRKLEVYDGEETPAKKVKVVDQVAIRDVATVPEYSTDIFKNLFKSEEDTIPSHNYLLDEKSEYHIRANMRAILVDWLVDVHRNFKCLPETLLLAINILDRVLSSTKVSVSKLQLVAVTSLFIACKYEEVKLPKIANFAYITDGAATVEDIREAEFNILETLRFNINWPNPLNFLRRLSQIDDYNYELRDIAKFVLEFIMCTHYFVNYKPSFLSAMAIYLSKRICNDESSNHNEGILTTWSATHTEYSGGINPNNDPKFNDSLNVLIDEFKQPSNSTKSLLAKYKANTYHGMFFRVQDWCLNYI